MVDNSITIGIVTYNSSSTIIETLNSLSSQTYSDFKVIISDDHSTDDTVFIIKSWMGENKALNVKLVENPINVGVSGNVKNLIELVDSKWLKLLGGDDLLMTNAIKSYYDFVSLNRCVKILASKCVTFGLYDVVLPRDSKHYLYEKNAKKQYCNLGIGNFVIAPTLFYEVNTLKKMVAGNNHYRLIEDLPILLNYTSLGYKIYFIDDVLVKYRVCNSSISLSSEKVTQYKLELMNIYSDYFSKHQYSFLFYLNFKVLSISHGMRSRKVSYIIKYISPLKIMSKIREIFV